MNNDLKIPYVDFVRQHEFIRKDLHKALDRILDTGQFILGDEVENFENEFASYIGTKYAIGVGSGTDALYLSMKALGIGEGDEVITAPNSYLASASSIALLGAKPVFIDIDTSMNIDPELIENAISDKTRAIMPVHLTGRPANISRLQEVASHFKLPIIEDAAQAAGAEYNGQKVGSFGLFGCFSLHPLKNLSALGDGGIITTNNSSYADWLRRARNHGHPSRDKCDFWSHNMRLDSLQAAFLREKLKFLDKVIEKRNEYANLYHEYLKDLVVIPKSEKSKKNAYHTYIIQTDKRDSLKQFLENSGIDTKIHYPTPIPYLEAAKYLNIKYGSFPNAENQANSILSLPIAEYLSTRDIQMVIQKIKDFF